MENNINFEKAINEQLGFEDDIDGIEDDDNEADGDYNDNQTDEEKPFNAESIRIDQQMLSLKYLYELYQDGVLKLHPDFQRQYVWSKRRRKSLLIESLMLRIPIPAFYFYEKKDGTFLVIDGQQRLQTFFDFLDNKFNLYGLEYLGTQEKKKFIQLDSKYQQRIRRTQLAINILDDRSPQNVIYDIFRRVNSGGMPLNPQEMRNAICSNETRCFLKKCVNEDAFLQATRKKIKPLRLDDQELFLRFVSIFHNYNYQTLTLKKLIPSKLSFLMNEEIANLDSLPEKEKNLIATSFNNSMKKCKELFGDYAFVNVKINENGKIGEKNKDLINKPLFVAFSVLLANPILWNIDMNYYKENVLKNLALKLCNDIQYQNSISKATGDERNIKLCLEKSLEVLKECGIIRQ